MIKSTRISQSLLALTILEGCIAIIIFLSGRSEAQNSFLWGYSLRRLGIIFLAAFLIMLFLGIFIISITKKDSFINAIQKFHTFLGNSVKRIVFLAPLSLIVLLSLGTILIYKLPILFNIVSFISIKPIILRESGIIPIWTFLLPLQTWFVLIGIKILIFARFAGKNQKAPAKKSSALMQLSALTATLFATVFLLTLLWIKFFRAEPVIILTGPAGKLVILSLWFLFCLWMEKYKPDRVKKHKILLTSISLWLFIFLYSAQLSQWMGSFNTPFKNYWNWLADAFLHGRLYLIDPPSMGDMTLHDGRIYIPIPPLPAILMMPFIAIWGVDGFNTTALSIALASTTSVFVFLSLEELARHKWIQLSRSGIIWIVTLFSLGTVHLWLSISSVVWYFSQVCTTFFVAMTFMFALKRYPAWLTGTALAVAILARPNVFILWPALLFFNIQFQFDKNKKIKPGNLLIWSISSALPIIGSVGILLYYNFLRFGNIFDFGYADLYGSVYVMENVKKFGMFNFHFIPTNLKSILPVATSLSSKCEYFFARGNGISMLTATPAIIYAFKRYKFSWWLTGSWTSVILSLLLLLTYHNNGAVQIAYRYYLDFAIPLIMIISFSAEKKISLLLKSLIIISIIINYYSIVSWYFGPC